MTRRPRFTISKYSKGEVDRAGQILINPESSEDMVNSALNILNSWRVSHGYPLNTFQIYLRKNSYLIDRRSLVAQRLKRVPSIIGKLVRFKNMNLSRMQDIGGCRAVLGSVKSVYDLLDKFKLGNLKHTLYNDKDYISEPKESGYRGIHLVYKYNSDKITTFNGFQVEIQLRTKLQHAWATAVETVGLFLQHSLKSSQGPEEWLKFFSYMGSVFANIERSPPIPGIPTKREELRTSVIQMARDLDVLKKLRAYSKALQVFDKMEDKNSHYYLLNLDATTETLNVKGFNKGQLELATDEYLAIEKSISGTIGKEAVLVSVDSIENLKLAYPNYFLDTNVFLETFARYVQKK